MERMAEPAFLCVCRSTRTAHRGTGVERYGASAGAEGSNDIGAESDPIKEKSAHEFWYRILPRYCILNYEVGVISRATKGGPKKTYLLGEASLWLVPALI